MATPARKPLPEQPVYDGANLSGDWSRVVTFLKVLSEVEIDEEELAAYEAERLRTLHES